MGRTVKDCLQRAAGAKTAAEREAWLDQGEAVAERAWELRDLLDGVVEHDLAGSERVAHLADGLLEASVAEVEVWGFRSVAEARLKLGDREGARAALQRGEGALDPEKQGFSWVILAGGYIRHLDDLQGARACLDRAAPTDLSGRCAIATARAEFFGEREQAEEALRGCVPADAHEVWTLSNAWRALGHEDIAEKLLAEALDAPSLPDVLSVARAFASHDLHGQADHALDVATGRAGSSAERLQLAEVCFDLGRTERVAALLGQVEQADDVDDHRQRLAAAWLWIGERERAEHIGARGLRPEDLREPVRALDGVPVSAAGLLDWLRPQVSDETLERIAGADYGWSHDKHLPALRDLRATGRVPAPLPWEPGEVLRLVRWDEGESIDHVSRAWCCTILCLDGDDLENDAPILVESALVLGDPAPDLAEGLLAWRYVTEDERLSSQLFSALWGLAALRAARDPADPLLDELARRAEALLADEWFTVDRVLECSLRRDLWRELGACLPDRWRTVLGGSSLLNP
jgi:hypothetical protein